MNPSKTDIYGYLHFTIFKKNEVQSNLFADDLASSCASNKPSVIEQAMKMFLNKLEK
jgi:hypothetical protein